MANTHQYFMWPFQSHFRYSRQMLARELFDRVSPRLKPEVFVIGVLAEEHEGRRPCCVESDDDFWIDSEDLSGLNELAEFVRSELPESRLMHSDVVAQPRATRVLDCRALKLAATKLVNAHPRKPEGKQYFIGYPMRVAGFNVMTVLGLDHKGLTAYPRLQSDSFPTHLDRSIPIPRSLAEAVVEQFLLDAESELGGQRPGEDLLLGNVQRILQDSAEPMVCGLAARCDRPEILVMGGYQSAYKRLAMISSIGYEQSEANGRIVLARQDHPAIQTKLQFRPPIPLGSLRHIRKLLEMTRGNSLALHTNSVDVWGLVEVDRASVCWGDEDLFEVLFEKKYVWECRQGESVICQVVNGTPRLLQPALDADRVTRDLLRLFPKMSNKTIESYVALLDSAVTQAHGTMVVISDAAGDEAARLGSQSTPVVPTPVDPSLAHAISAIDGAVLLGADGLCYSVGVILDGVATSAGNAARGARYNSAVRYLESRKQFERCMAIIVSEDGDVDIYPAIRPAIARREIAERLRQLQEIASEHEVPRKYYELVNWMDDHRFYLLDDDCEILNRVVPVIEERVARANPSHLRFHRRPWSVDASMRPDWYYT